MGERAGLLDRLGAGCPVREAGPEDHVDGVPAQVVASPTSAEETSAVMRACSEHGLAVVVRGHGSKLEWGRPPERVDVILETAGMAELVEHARGDLIATVGAGMPLGRLNSLVSEARHQLVVDDLAAGRGLDAQGSTLGGAMATNLSGPRRLWVGAMRDLVLGVRFVRADGTVAKAGGKVVKNVAGYDLGKLLTGSFGTLAVITEVTVRLHPEPRASRAVVARCPTEQLAEVLSVLQHSQLALRSLELDVEPGSDPALTAGVEGHQDGTARRAEQLGATLRGLVGDRVHVLDPGEDGLPAEDTTREPARAPSPATEDELVGVARPTLLKVTGRLSGIPELVRVATEHGLSLTGSAGVGVLHARLPEETELAAAVRAVTAVRASSVAHGGSTVVLDAPPAVKQRVDSWGEVPGLDLMRRVKAEFDPQRLLAPGRFVGGL